MWFIFRAVTNQVHVSYVKDEYRSHMATILIIHEYIVKPSRIYLGLQLQLVKSKKAEPYNNNCMSAFPHSV